MEDGRENDLRVPLISSLFCLCVTAGGVFLVVYVFVPGVSQPWFPVAAFILIGAPWLFWLFAYLYTCLKACWVRSHESCGPQPNRSSSTTMQGRREVGGSAVGRHPGEHSSNASSRNSDVPLAYSV